TPVAVSGLTKVTQIAGGAGHSVAVRSDGTAVAWGSNNAGQLGDGTTTNRTTPVPVSGLTGVTQVSAGGEYSLAVRSNGGVVAWGYNAYGQLGDGTTTRSSIPVTVSGLTNIARVSAGDYHGVALRTDGTVVAWGYNGSGQLGDGTTTNRLTPVPVPGLSGVTQVSAGGYHTLAKAGPPELTAKAAITGTRNVGATLACSAAFLTATSIGYTWLRDGTTIPGAATAAYTPVAGDAGHQVTCQVTATNSAGSTDTSATITIHAPAHFTTGTTPIAHVGKHYSHRFAATGSPTPKIALAAGTLPPGLKLAADGTLAGTPKRKGTYRFTLSATNGIGTPAKATESVIVR
ncbi:MAG: chromosome condensation regulator, partial [Actinomycetia bacterium]|nr:chromosome condensation regulator [Actinomycetes bacterium]